MKRLQSKDVFDIMNLFELELYTIRNLTKKDTIQIRKKLNSQLRPALLTPIKGPSDIIRQVENKLEDVLRSFRDKEDFLSRLSKILNEKLQTPEEKALAQIKDLDAEIFRKKFDEIGFSRSSSLRLLLTRILEDSTSVDQMQASIEREAKKISSPEEITILLHLKEKRKLSFMAGMIDLLAKKAEKQLQAPEEKSLSISKEVFEKIQNIDIKTVRKRFDEAGFSRSSSLRLIITRILRDSIDKDELLTSIHRETKKITSKEDIAALQQLQTTHSFTFMADIIDLLLEKIDKNIK